MIYAIGVYAMTAFGIGYVFESAWRLWQNKPAHYLSALAELLIAAVFIVVIISMPTVGLAGVVAKSIAVVGWTAGAVLRVIARQRFAAQT